MLRYAATLSAVALLITGCQTDQQKPGTEGAQCQADGTCLEGLECFSRRCVKVPADYCARARPTAPGKPSPEPELKKLGEKLSEYQRKVRAMEAQTNLKRIRIGARVFFVSDHWDQQGNLMPKIFPPSSEGWTPKVPCCKQADGVCTADPELWKTTTWRQLRFSLLEPHYYQYRFTSGGENKEAKFMVEARGDLDCDGTFSSYSMSGRITEEYGVLVEGPKIKNPLE